MTALQITASFRCTMVADVFAPKPIVTRGNNAIKHRTLTVGGSVTGLQFN